MNTTIELQKLELSEEDFKMINEGLESLPNKDMAGDLMVTLLGGMLMKDDPDEKAKFKEDMRRDAMRKDQQKQLLIENVRILQGKILLLQRYLRMNGLLKQANDILQP